MLLPQSRLAATLLTGAATLCLASSTFAQAPHAAQTAYLKASNTDADDWFGDVIAMDGDTLVVGAAYEDSAATGINGDQLDNSIPNTGAVYVYARSGSSWVQQAYIKSSHPTINDRFGFAVAISGDTIAVGVPRDDSASSGIGGDPGNGGLHQSGAVFIFRRSGSTWAQEEFIKASNPSYDDEFGRHVQLSGDMLLVGAPYESSGSISNQADNSVVSAGAAYVFVRSGTTWTQEAYLKAANPETLDQFGTGLALAGDTIVIGAPYEDSDSTGIGGDDLNNNGVEVGAAFVFARTGTTWNQQAYIKASNAGSNDYFGFSMSLSDETLAIGAFGESSDSTGVNGSQNNENAPFAGAVYFFERNGTTWHQQDYLKASNTGPSDLFGSAVNLAGDSMLVAAVAESSAATGVNGDGSDESALYSGAVYHFARNGGTWEETNYFKASNTEAGDSFGNGVAQSGTTIICSSIGEGSDATNLQGDQLNNNMPFAGSVYIYELDPSPGTPYCFGYSSITPCPCGNDDPYGGCKNSSGLGARLAGSGSSSALLDDLVLTATNVPVNRFGMIFMADGNSDAPFGDGKLCASGNITRLGIQNSGASGTIVQGAGIMGTYGLFAGMTRNFQCWYRDPLGPCGGGFNTSNGYSVLVTL